MPRSVNAPAAPAQSNGQPERSEKLALNIADLTRVHELVRAACLRNADGGDRLDRATGPIQTDAKRLDEGAVALCNCSLITQAALVDFLRNADRRAGEQYP